MSIEETQPVIVDTKRSNKWRIILELEDSADLAQYIAGEGPWPLVKDPAVMLKAVERHFRGRSSVEMPDVDWGKDGHYFSGSDAQIVGIAVEPPAELLTDQSFREGSDATKG